MLNKIAICFFFTVLSINGQTNTHLNAWGRISFAYHLQETHLKFESELQKRTQNNGIVQNSVNPFDENLMQSFRFWIHYNKKNTPLNFLFSPIGYFENSSIIEDEQDIAKQKVYEYRVSAAVDYKMDLFSKTSIFFRTALEFRDFQNITRRSILRFRGKTGLLIDLRPKLKIKFFDELFLNTNSEDKKHLFDQNRIGTLVNYHFNEALKFEIGYVAISRLQRSEIDVMFDHNFLFMLYYTLKHKQ